MEKKEKNFPLIWKCSTIIESPFVTLTKMKKLLHIFIIIGAFILLDKYLCKSEYFPQYSLYEICSLESEGDQFDSPEDYRYKLLNSKEFTSPSNTRQCNTRQSSLFAGGTITAIYTPKKRVFNISSHPTNLIQKMESHKFIKHGILRV